MWYKFFKHVWAHFTFELSTNGVFALSKGKCLGLGKVVGQQDGVMVFGCTNGLGEFVVSLDWGKEVTRNHLGTLVNQLIECVLSVGSRLSPDNGTSLNCNLLAILGDVLSVGLHVSLLKVSRKTVHVLVIRQDSDGLGAVEVVVPETNQSKGERQVFLGRCVDEVLIDRVGTS